MRRAALLLMILSCGAAGRAAAEEPLSLTNTVHLLLDDYLIHQSDGVERKVIPPSRFLPNPIVTGAPEHQNWQPFLTVLHDPERPEPSRFRMWYNADVVDDPADGAFFGKTALLESADGVHWPGPYERLNSLAEDGRVRFGANVLDEGRGHEPLAERYKMLYFDAGRQVGPRVAFSADGRHWRLHESGKPILAVNNGDAAGPCAWSFPSETRGSSHSS
jgi:hypothetical protein